ncbi:MAG TPA: methionine synthase [Dictyoglomaceae bacterium]|nr:methionine synthase [Dictyoglomaceae bacterium]
MKEIKLPILPTTSVGSFPKPDYLIKARNQYSRGLIPYSTLHELELKATEEVIKMQEELGVDILVHGEMERGDMATYFAENLEGFTISGLVRSYGNRYYKKPIVIGKIKRTKPITVDMFKFAQSLTKKPIKGMLTGPYTIADWSFNEYYENKRDLTLDLAEVINQEALDLEEEGAIFIQIDEPAIPTHPEEIKIAKESFQRATRGLRNFIITHICYGDFRPIWEELIDFPVHQFDFELTNNADKFYPLIENHGFPKDKYIAIGVIDVHSHRIESVEEIKARIKEAFKYFKPEQIFIDPDCGLKTRTWEEAKAKMENMVKAVEELREELTKEAYPTEITIKLNS